MPIEKIIVVEDELIVRKSLEQQLRQRRYDVASAETLAATHELLGRDTWDLLFVDVRLPDGEGTELLQQLQSRPQRPLVVITTGFGSVQSAVECMRNGAFDYLLKPYSPEQLDVTLRKAEQYTQLLKVSQHLSHESDDDSSHELLGRSEPIETLRQLIRKVARTNATVLIQGESGTGKELVARALYRQSPRANAPFIKVNCAAIPENLIESEFFGHEKGAFTGALNKREGRFELAHGGTILLDEISEISPSVQAKLLRVLQERELERVGGNRTIRVDVRVVATTNRHLKDCVDRKEFRQDLFFRLNVVPICVPPLREHREDIPLLAEQFLLRYARKHGVRIQGLAPRCLEALAQQDWPGNVRELQNVLERAVILSGDGDTIDLDQVGLARWPSLGPNLNLGPWASPALQGNGGTPPPAAKTAPPSDVLSLAEVEKRHILAALAQTGGNRTHAARLLDISIRTLRNKLNEYKTQGVDLGDAPAAEEAEDACPTPGQA
ncbi:MAG: sigma-54-dependent Fis family transcriptional regulator [Verrucomicrobia bacterium]|nr:sigma-54-dependent Fis family transcriptional regulator [Verrucomicrobiota bacterium]